MITEKDIYQTIPFGAYFGFVLYTLIEFLIFLPLSILQIMYYWTKNKFSK